MNKLEGFREYSLWKTFKNGKVESRYFLVSSDTVAQMYCKTKYSLRWLSGCLLVDEEEQRKVCVF